MAKTNFDDLPKKQQKELLQIANKQAAIKDAIKKHNKKTTKVMKTTFKKFLSKDGKFTESEVPLSNLKYKKKYVARVQNISGQFIERCMITLKNNYQLSITRPTYVYGADPDIFDISPRKPSGELDTTLLDSTQINQDILQGQTIKDISKHINTLGIIDPNAEVKKAAEDKT